MKRSATFCHLTMLTLSVFLLSSHRLWADTYVYSWSGIIEKKPDATADPWSIGESGKPFEISVYVDSMSRDMASPVIIARFLHSLSSDPPPPWATFSIDGNAATWTEVDHITFEDRDLGSEIDIINCGIDVEFAGVIESLASGLSLAETTFAFTERFEQPPLFAPTATVSWSKAYAPGNYQTRTPAGTAVTSIPEPCTLVLLGMSALGLLAYGWRRRRVAGAKRSGAPVVGQ